MARRKTARGQIDIVSVPKKKTGSANAATASRLTAASDPASSYAYRFDALDRVLTADECFQREPNRLRRDLPHDEARLFFSANGTVRCQPGVERREGTERRATLGILPPKAQKAPTGRPESGRAVFNPKHTVHQWTITLANDWDIVWSSC